MMLNVLAIQKASRMNGNLRTRLQLEGGAGRRERFRKRERGRKGISTDVFNISGALRQLQRHAEQATRKFFVMTARVVENINLRMMLKRDFAHDRQSQSAAFDMAAEDTVKALEYMGTFRRRDARPGIFDFQNRLLPFVVCAYAYRHAALRRRVA